MSFRSCEEVRLLLSDLVAGALERSDADSLESHLSACTPCRDHAEAILWQDRVLTELGVQARLDDLVARIRRRIEGAVVLEVTAEGAVRPRRAWAPSAVAAAACLAVLLGGWLLLPREGESDRPLVKETIEPEPGPVDVKNPDRFLPAPVVTPPKTPEVRKPVPAPAPPKAVAARKPDSRKEPEKKRATDLPKKVVPPPLPEPSPLAARAKKAQPEHKIIDIPKKLTVGDAIAHGVKFLHTRVEGVMERGKTVERKLVENELLLWTMVHAGVPESHPTFRALFGEMMARPLERTYRVALQAMILEELDRVKYQPRIAQCAQFLVDNQGRNGEWSYGDPSVFAQRDIVSAVTPSRPRKNRVVRIRGPKPGERVKPKVTRFVKIVKQREGRRGGDNSNTMYAALGLRACHDAGMLIPPQVIDRAQKWWREAQKAAPKGRKSGPRGWCYGGRSHTDHPAYGSMTAGAVGSLAIYDYIQKKDWSKDAAIRDGMAWLAENFSVTANPGTPEHGGGNPQYQYFYYMYALERAGMLNGADTIGEHDWYKEGERTLLDVQRPDGAWQGGNVRDTCFAILFLKRATTPLPSISTGGRR